MTPPHDELIQALSSLSVEDMQSLIRKLEQRLGFTASPAPRTFPIAVPAYGCPPSPQRSRSRLELRDPGPNKLHVLIYLRNTIRAFGDLPIADAKRKLDAGPIVLSSDVYPAPEMIEIQRALEELGAKVENTKLSENDDGV